MFLFIQI